ncbi:Zn-dependent exopeptidase [Delitschia confertaspora ATCC 74209]|uniref:Peptide hydrolase n=1 Tax=Delitschia confertaspora ATCC 74209 TaxID=1513339 RepID=A0A9P4JSG9_9PLEO|nr:Zn-dependent exopeptidase [Delitschia confertaspora ATCC 74209]
MVAIQALLFGALAASAVAAPANPHDDKGNHGRPVSKLPLVNSKALQSSIKIKELMKGAQKLQDLAYSHPERNRLMGGAGHNDTIKYIKNTLESLGGYYKVELQQFSTLIQLSEESSLTISNAPVQHGVMEYSPSGNATAPVIVVNNFGCEASDYPTTVSGNIALISRGTCDFGLKSVLAGLAGAKAAMIYNNIPGGLNGTLGVPRAEGPYIPTVSLSQEDGTALRTSITGGTAVSANLFVETVITNATTNNVIATTNNGLQNQTLMLGAHTDSVAAGPGINDDGSGTIAILEVAKQLAKYRVNNAVRFGFWSGEEEGLLGSTYYVEHLPAAELAKVRAYLNFDMIASPNFIYGIYDGDGSSYNMTGPAGSAEIEHFFERYFKSNRLPFTATEFNGRSDYQAFIDNGIPAGGTDTGADRVKTAEEAKIFGGTAGIILDPNYHQAADTVSNLNQTAWIVNAKAIAAAVAEYGTSFKSLPPKEAPTKKRSMLPSVRETSAKRRVSRKTMKSYQ